MGANLSYLAIKSKSTGEICEELSLRRTGQWCDGWGGGITAGKSPTDWYVIVDRYDEIVRDSNKAQVLGKLSRGAEVLHCEISEGSMISGAELWREGTKIWSVRHEADYGSEHLAVEGTPPAQFSAIRDEMVAKGDQEERKSYKCDWYFEIPAQLAKSLSGFDYTSGFVRNEPTSRPRGYDEDEHGDEGDFEVLELD